MRAGAHFLDSGVYEDGHGVTVPSIARPRGHATRPRRPIGPLSIRTSHMETGASSSLSSTTCRGWPQEANYPSDPFNELLKAVCHWIMAAGIAVGKHVEARVDRERRETIRSSSPCNGTRLSGDSWVLEIDDFQTVRGHDWTPSSQLPHRVAPIAAVKAKEDRPLGRSSFCWWRGQDLNL